MRWFIPSSTTRGGAAIPDMTLQPGFIDPTDICNRAINEGLGYPASKTNRLLERGKAGSVFWMECPDNLWATITPHLTAGEIASAVTSEPASYARDDDRNRMSVFDGKSNLVAITDSLGWNKGSAGTAGIDSYVTKAFTAWAGATRTPNGGKADSEYITANKALLHNGNGGSFFGGVNDSDFANDHEMMRPVKYTTLNMAAGDIFYIALGTNDWSNDGAANGAAVWARAQTFVGGMVSDHPNAKIIVATVPRRSDVPATNTKIADYNTLLKAGYVALGVAAICDIEQAHPDFSTSTGNSAGKAYLDGTHFSDVGIAAAKATLTTTLLAI